MEEASATGLINFIPASLNPGGLGLSSGASTLAAICRIDYLQNMSAEDIAEAVMELPEQERLDLARRIVATIAVEREATKKISEAVQGIEDIVTGTLQGLTEAEFRDALK